MEGVITIQDSRSNVDALKSWRAKEVATLSRSAKNENKIDNAVNITKSIVSIAGTIATIVMSLCPVDGPVGDTLTVLAKPQLVGAVEASRGLLKGAIVNNDIKQVKASLADVMGNVKEISVKDWNIVQTVGVEKSVDMSRMEQSSGMQY